MFRLAMTVFVGRPEQAVKESTHRIERAMVNSGFARASSLDCPVFEFQSRHLGKVPLISGKQRSVQ
jgi:hypothetical protein